MLKPIKPSVGRITFPVAERNFRLSIFSVVSVGSVGVGFVSSRFISLCLLGLMYGSQESETNFYSKVISTHFCKFLLSLPPPPFNKPI